MCTDSRCGIGFGSTKQENSGQVLSDLSKAWELRMVMVSDVRLSNKVKPLCDLHIFSKIS